MVLLGLGHQPGLHHRTSKYAAGRRETRRYLNFKSHRPQRDLCCCVPRSVLRGLAEPGDHVLPVQLLGDTAAHNVPVPDAGERVEVDAVGLLHGRDQLVGHVRDQAANNVPQRRVLGARPKAHRSQLLGETPVESNQHARHTFFFL